MQRINGRAIAKRIIDQLKKSPTEKILAAVLVGNDPASIAFLKIKEKTAEELGVKFQLLQFPESINQSDLARTINYLSADPTIGGIVLQLPLPKVFDRDQILKNLVAEKDVDALTDQALVEPPAVGVAKEILKEVDWDLSGKKVVVVGKGFLVGQPISQWLAKRKVNFKIADSKTENLKEFLAEADLIITGVGKSGLIRPDWLKDGVGIIDFGYPADLDLKSEILNLKSGFYTPTPGGTGPILVAKLFENFFTIWQKYSCYI